MSRLQQILIIACGALLAASCRPGPAASVPASNKASHLSTGARNSQKPEGLAGNYTVTGKNLDGTSYEGDLEIIKRGEVYQFLWRVGREYDGIGIENGSTVAVSFSDGKDGRGCGVVNYRLGEGGTLNGRWGYWGINQSGAETATRLAGAGPLTGEYVTSGQNYDGKKYRGKLFVQPTGGGYNFTWDNGDEGFGIRQGGNIVASVGETPCNFVAYQVKPDGSLKGLWGGGGDNQIGTEEAVRK